MDLSDSYTELVSRVAIVAAARRWIPQRLVERLARMAVAANSRQRHEAERDSARIRLAASYALENQEARFAAASSRLARLEQVLSTKST